MNEMNAGGFPENLMDEIYLMAEENETAVDFSYSEKQGEEGKDEILTEEQYNNLQRQQCSKRKPSIRMNPRINTRPTKRQKRKILRAVERTDKVLSDAMIDRIINIMGS